MITKNDCLSILVQLGDNGITDADFYIKKLLGTREPSIEVLKFISENRGLEVSNFYEMLRKSYNKKKSDLYINIVKEDFNTEEAIITLSCFLTQVVLYGKKLTNADAFFREVRAEEITRVLNNFFNTGSYDACVALLRLIKADLVVLEYIRGRRELQ